MQHGSTQLLSMLQQMVQYNQSQMYKRLSRQLRMNDLELPLAYFYKSMMEYCSIVVAGIVVVAPTPTTVTSNMDIHQDDDDDRMGDDGNAPRSSSTSTRRTY
jgi:hypothetical protein